MPHTAELIAVGTELLLGSIANTDAQMLSRELSALGIHVYYHTVVGRQSPAAARRGGAGPLPGPTSSSPPAGWALPATI